LGLKTKGVELAIIHDKVPMRIRWEQAVSAVGSMYRRFFYLLEPDKRPGLTKMMEEWGVEHSGEVLEKLGVQRDLHSCALALMSYHRVFGIKSFIAEESEDEIVIHATHCMWKDKRDWTPQICTSIEAFEAGLVRGIDGSIRHHYSKRRSLGHKVCEMHLTY
jgi:hypothetical protein